MKINFSDLVSKKERKKEISYEVQIDSFVFEGDIIKPVSDVKVEGMATSDDNIINVQLHISCELEFSCSRCLETFIYPIDIDIEERFTNDSDLINEKDDLIFVKDDVLDVTEIVENSIISTLPIKRLCKEDCKGLCQSCGVNLNKENCNCNNDDYDPRLEGLRTLLNDKEV